MVRLCFSLVYLCIFCVFRFLKYLFHLLGLLPSLGGNEIILILHCLGDWDWWEYISLGFYFILSGRIPLYYHLSISLLSLRLNWYNTLINDGKWSNSSRHGVFSYYLPNFKTKAKTSAGKTKNQAKTSADKAKTQAKALSLKARPRPQKSGLKARPRPRPGSRPRLETFFEKKNCFTF